MMIREIRCVGMCESLSLSLHDDVPGRGFLLIVNFLSFSLLSDFFFYYVRVYFVIWIEVVIPLVG